MEKNKLKEQLKSLLKRDFLDEQIEAFQTFIEELKSWSLKQSLVSKGDLEKLVERHIADSLILGLYIKKKSNVVDIGSGAGFPGIPLAVVMPDSKFSLIEPRKKRVGFLNHIKRVINLKNTTIYEGRADHFPEVINQADTLVLRALGDLEALFESIKEFFKPELEILILTSAKKEQKPINGMDSKRIPYSLHGSDWNGVVWKLNVSRETFNRSVDG